MSWYSWSHWQITSACNKPLHFFHSLLSTRYSYSSCRCHVSGMKEIKEYSHINFEEFHSFYHFMPSTLMPTYSRVISTNKEHVYLQQFLASLLVQSHIASWFELCNGAEGQINCHSWNQSSKLGLRSLGSHGSDAKSFKFMLCFSLTCLMYAWSDAPALPFPLYVPYDFESHSGLLQHPNWLSECSLIVLTALVPLSFCNVEG